MTDTQVCKCVLFLSLCELLDMLMRNGYCLLRLSDILPTQYETIPVILLISRPVENSLPVNNKSKTVYGIRPV